MTLIWLLEVFPVEGLAAATGTVAGSATQLDTFRAELIDAIAAN